MPLAVTRSLPTVTDVGYVEGELHVRTRCRFVSTVFSETVGLSYRKPAAKTTEGTRGTLPKKQKKLTSR